MSPKSFEGPESSEKLESLDVLAEDRAARRLAQTRFDQPLVLEAGAGTGKTTTLVARILSWTLGAGWEHHQRLYAEADRPSESSAARDERIAAAVLQRVVAITFTEAAAAEMAGRVGEELAAVADGELPVWLLEEALPELSTRTRRARALAGTLDRLVVRTIHAFCRGLLADHPLEAGLHPDLEVDADGRITEQLCRETVLASLTQAYGEPGDESALALAADEHGPESVAETLTTLVAAGARSEDFDAVPLGSAAVQTFLQRLESSFDAFLEAAGALEGVSKRSRQTLATLEAARGARRRLESEVSEAGGEEEREPWQRLQSLVEDLRAGWDDKDLSRLRDWSRGTFNKSEGDALGAAGGRSVQSAAGTLYPLLRHTLRLEPARLHHGRRVLRPLLASVRRQLRARGAVTFPDLLLEARDLLIRRDGVRRKVQRGIDQLLVDEFQDTDDLQCELLRALALEGPEKERPGLFLVGDPKQSIYGWRSADLAAYDGFLEAVRKAGGTVLPLSENFRSVPAILDEVNRTVEPVMVEAHGLQPRFEPLVPCQRLADKPGFAHGAWAPVEHWVSWRRDEEGAEGEEPTPPSSGPPTGPKTRAADAVAVEAAAVARDLLRLRRRENVPWGEVALLLRSTGDLDDYLEALRRAGIPFAVGRDKQYYRRREIIDAAALVRAILDPGDPVALLAVLRSPMAVVPDAALVPLWNQSLPRLAAENRLPELRRAVAEAARRTPRDVPGLDRIPAWPEAAAKALEHLVLLRRSYHHEPADCFLERLRATFLQEVLESGRYLGRHRLANLDRFFRQLHEVLTEGGDIPGLLRLLRRSVAEAQDAEEARPPSAENDAVQVLTIHGAKGLDFQHVYLLQLHKQPPPPDFDLRPQLKRRRQSTEYRIFGAATLAFDAVQEEEAAVAAAERVRLLYVAMTRAKERMVLAGCWSGSTEPTPPDQASTLLQLLAHRQPPAPDLGELFAQPAATASHHEAAQTRWIFPDLLDADADDEPWTGSAVGALPAPAQVRRGIQELRRLQAAARRHMQRPVSRAASAEAHRRLERVLEEDSETSLRSSATGEAQRPRPAAGRQIAMATGSVVHRILETLRLEAPAEEEWQRQASNLPAYAAAVQPTRPEPGMPEPGMLDEVLEAGESWLQRLQSSRLAARLFELGEDAVLARELSVLLPPEPVLREPALKDPQLGDNSAVGFVSGIIDLVYRDPETGEVVLADFKTDEIADGDDGLQRRTDAYRSQGEIYRRALKEALSLPVAPRFELWYLYADRIVVALPAGDG
ncbi:MAG: UvrD-helicase domain-containing protein [Acidobacteriota bacterium]|nr:UvrD-helicase domain-containing protein [Acidobacteriota bacterium]